MTRYLGQAVQVPIFCKWAGLPFRRCHAATFPESHLLQPMISSRILWNKCSECPVALPSTRAPLPGLCSPPAPLLFLMPVQKTLVNDCIKDRKRKGCREDYLICEFANFTCINIFFTCRKDTVKTKVLQKTWQSLPRSILEHSNPCQLSSSHDTSHEPLLTPMSRLVLMCCQWVQAPGMYRHCFQLDKWSDPYCAWERQGTHRSKERLGH